MMRIWTISTAWIVIGLASQGESVAAQQRQCDPHDGWCSDSGLPANALRLLVSFLILVLSYWLRDDRLFAIILLMWNLSMLVFAFVENLAVWYMFVFADLYLMRKYLNQKKQRLSKLDMFDSMTSMDQENTSAMGGAIQQMQDPMAIPATVPDAIPAY